MLQIFIFITLFSFQDVPNCTSVKEGNYRIDQKSGFKDIVTFIERKGSIQIEKCEEAGIELEFKIEWLNECQYTLVLLETLRDDNNFNYPENEVITVTIKEVHKDYYVQSSSSKIYPDFTFESKVYKL